MNTELHKLAIEALVKAWDKEMGSISRAFIVITRGIDPRANKVINNHKHPYFSKYVKTTYKDHEPKFHATILAALEDEKAQCIYLGEEKALERNENNEWVATTEL